MTAFMMVVTRSTAAVESSKRVKLAVNSAAISTRFLIRVSTSVRAQMASRSNRVVRSVDSTRNEAANSERTVACDDGYVDDNDDGHVLFVCLLNSYRACPRGNLPA